jgi:hypothetical protein
MDRPAACGPDRGRRPRFLLSGIFGVVHRDGAPVDPALPALMRDALTDGVCGRARSWSQGSAALAGYSRDARAEAPAIYDHDGDLVFTAAARLDNRRGLISELGLRGRPGQPGSPADAEVLLAAYRRWGESATERALGTGPSQPGTLASAGCSWPATISATGGCTTTPTRARWRLPGRAEPWRRSGSRRWCSMSCTWPSSWSGGPRTTVNGRSPLPSGGCRRRTR